MWRNLSFSFSFKDKQKGDFNLDYSEEEWIWIRRFLQVLGKSKTSLLGSVPASDKKVYFSLIMAQKNDANMAEVGEGLIMVR